MSVPEQTKLLGLLTEFEELFDGAMGDWYTEPVSFQLEEGTNNIMERFFNSKSTQCNHQKGGQQIVQIWVTKVAVWVGMGLAIIYCIKKDQTIWFVSDSMEVNK